MSLIDLAAGQHARTVAPRRYVTKVIHEVIFIAPVYVGDTVSFYASTSKIGRTSLTIRVDVEANRWDDASKNTAVTSAEVIMVAINDKGEPIPIME